MKRKIGHFQKVSFCRKRWGIWGLCNNDIWYI